MVIAFLPAQEPVITRQYSQFKAAFRRNVQHTYQRRPRRDIYLQEIAPPVPRQIGREEARFLHVPPEAAKQGIIRVEEDAVRARLLGPDAVIGEAFGRMEIEDPQQARTLEDEDLVELVLQAYVGLRRVQPAVLLLRGLHRAVELVQELVPQQAVLCQVELPAGVPEGVAVAGAGEVEPLRVPELVALEVEVALAAKAVGNEPDHLVQGEAAFDDGC